MNRQGAASDMRSTLETLPGRQIQHCYAFDPLICITTECEIMRISTAC